MNGQRIMVVGPVGVGKSTLLHALYGGDPVTKTQSLQYGGQAIDTPGEFVDNPFYHHALFATALEATLIVFLQAADGERLTFPPGFTSGFPKKAIGVVTKTDLTGGDVERATDFLAMIGVARKDIFPVSALHGDGITQLKEFLDHTLQLHEGGL